MSRSIHLQGQDWTPPDASTAWQRERAEAPLTPIHNEFTGRRKLLSWTACAIVGSLMWAAFFCWILG